MQSPAPRRSHSFSVNNKCQRLLAIAILLFGLAAWCVQLGGVTSLQAACEDDLHLGNNDVDGIQALLAQQQQLIRGLAAINPTQPLPATAGLAVVQSLVGINKMLAQLTYRSLSIFTLTPDHNCSEYYRYQWLNVSLQIVVLAFACYCLFAGFLHMARVAVCSLLVVSSVLAIENAQTFFHVRQYAPDLTLQRGKVFFIGCCLTCAANLLLLFVLGIHDEQAGYPVNPAYSGDGTPMDRTPGKAKTLAYPEDVERGSANTTPARAIQ